MTAQWNLHLRREEPDRECSTAVEPANKGRLGKVQLLRDVQHQVIAELRVSDTNARRISFERPIRECIDDERLHALSPDTCLSEGSAMSSSSGLSAKGKTVPVGLPASRSAISVEANETWVA